MNGKIYCSKCGAVNENESKFCVNCGSTIENNQAPIIQQQYPQQRIQAPPNVVIVEQPQQPRSSNLLCVCIIVCLAICFTLGIAFIFYYIIPLIR